MVYPDLHARAVAVQARLEEAQLNAKSLLDAKSFRRAFVAALLFAIPALTAVQAGNEETEWRHGLSLYGDLKYKPGFKHFDYVNTNAPKGGSVRQVAIGTFDNFNQVIEGAKGNMASGVGLIFDSLLTPAMDEVWGTLGDSTRERIALRVRAALPARR